MKGFIEIQTEDALAMIAVSSIAAITKRGGAMCVLTFNTPIPSVSHEAGNMSVLITKSYDDLQALIKEAQES